MNMPLVSVVVPVYGCAQGLEELCTRLEAVLSRIVQEFEVILVNDASPDDSWRIISEIAARDARFVGVRLSRNFGQHPAISAGLARAKGEWMVVMDCDLQDRPEEIERLYEKALEGFEQVVAVRTNRQDSWFKRFASRRYVTLLSYLGEQKINPAVGNFGIYHRCVIDVVNSMTEQGRTFGLLVLWAGFRRYELEVQHLARPYGSSSYSFRSLFRLGLHGVISHSDKPLRLTVKFGAYVATVSFFLGLWLIGRYFVSGQSPQGWASIMVMLAMLSGILLASIGMVGLYVGRIFDETKARPTYIVWTATDDPPRDRSPIPQQTEGS